MKQSHYHRDVHNQMHPLQDEAGRRDKAEAAAQKQPN